MATIVMQVFLSVVIHTMPVLLDVNEYPAEHEIVQTSKFPLYDQTVTSYVKDKSKAVRVHAMNKHGRSTGTAALDS